MLVSTTHKQLILNLGMPDRVLTIIPKAKELFYKGHRLIAVPHQPEETAVLRNLGIQAPAPIEHHYRWPAHGLTPMRHQGSTGSFLSCNPRAFCLNGMGTGKTLSALWAADYLLETGTIDWVVVLSPLSTLERAWGDELFLHFPHLQFAVVHGKTPAKRVEMIQNPANKVLILNHDGIKNASVLEALATRPGKALVLIDELASFRNATTDRWKAANRLVNGDRRKGWAPKQYVWGMTGTPTPNEPTDVYGQVKLVNPSNMIGPFTSFKERVMRKITEFKWVPKDDALETAHRVMQPSIRFSREDCLDLPPTTYSTRQIPLTPAQKAAYDQMLKELSVTIGETTASAANEAVKINKLLQICTGCIYADGQEIATDCGPRIEETVEIIEQAQAKVLVFVPFTAALFKVREALADRFGERAVAMVYGGTPAGERSRTFQSFQSDPLGPRILVANPGPMAHGLTLTAANTIVWFAPVNSNETYQQANARVPRPGQKLDTHIINLEGSPLEREMYRRLERRESTQGVLLNMHRAQG